MAAVTTIVPAARILLVDDEPQILEFYQAVLGPRGYTLETAADGTEAVQKLATSRFDLIVSDVSMPGMDGLSLLSTVRATDLDVPVILITGGPSLETAMKALEYGALRYLTKPVEPKALRQVVDYGLSLHKMAKMKREALKLLRGQEGIAADRAGLESRFATAVEDLWLAFQPIVSWSGRKIVAFEALVRSGEPTLANPAELLETAERLGKLHDLGRRIRDSVAVAFPRLPAKSEVFVNLHPYDLEDLELYSASAAMSAFAPRIVLEVTERASLDTIPDARRKIAKLRTLGFRIALDDLGAGHAGLSTFAKLEPDLVKLDMSLTRGADREPIRKQVIASMVDLCKKLQMEVVTEGIETAAERDAIVDAGCDLLQGYLFARPSRENFTAIF